MRFLGSIIFGFLLLVSSAFSAEIDQVEVYHLFQFKHAKVLNEVGQSAQRICLNLSLKAWVKSNPEFIQRSKHVRLVEIIESDLEVYSQIFSEAYDGVTTEVSAYQASEGLVELVKLKDFSQLTDFCFDPMIRGQQ